MYKITSTHILGRLLPRCSQANCHLIESGLLNDSSQREESMRGDPGLVSGV